MPLAQMHNQSLFHMASYLNQCSAAITVMKVARPPSRDGIDFVHYPLKRHDRPLPFGEVGYPVFDGSQGFLRWLNMGIQLPNSAFSHPEGEPKKVELSFMGIDYFRLCLVEGEFQPLQYLPQCCHGFVSFTSFAEDACIISISDDAGTQSLFQVIPLPYPVQYMQVEIGQQR